jgi:hypothetical protein
MDPSYDPALPQRIFADFRKYLAAGLLEPVGAEHLYHAAENSTACRLTPLGRLYWQIAKAKRL